MDLVSSNRNLIGEMKHVDEECVPWISLFSPTSNRV